MVFLEHRCPNRPYKDDPLQECRAELAGPSIDTILAHNFTKGPFEDLRFCPKCHCMVSITISNEVTLLPTYRLMPGNEQIDFIQPWMSETIGRKPIKNRGKKCHQEK